MVDIDGVISLFGFATPTGTSRRLWRHALDPLVCRSRARERADRSIRSTAYPTFFRPSRPSTCSRCRQSFELVWASGWEEKANEYLPHLLGLPALPHLSFERAVGRTNAHWKLDAIEAYAGESGH